MTNPNCSSVTLKVTDSSTYVVGKLTKELYQEFKKTLGYKDPNALWRGKNAKNWDGYITTVCYDKARCRCSIKKDGVHFPTGLYSRALDFFRAYGVQVSVVDNRTEAAVRSINISATKELQVRAYQQETIDKAVQQQRGIIKAATGAGKTAIAAGIIAKLGISPFVFYVTSQDLLQQAKEEFEKFLQVDGKPLDVGIIGGGKCDVKDINIMTVQTAIRAVGEKYKKFDDEDDIDENTLTDKYDQISRLIHTSKGYMADECITGEAKVVIKNYGIQEMRDLGNFVGQEILSFNGTSVVWNKITKFFDQGIKKILSIYLANGDYIKCTENHLIMTKRGWVHAANLREDDLILSIANADVVKKLAQKQDFQAKYANIFLGIKYEREREKSGSKNSMNLSQKPLYVHADANSELICDIGHLTRLLKIGGQPVIENLFMDMTKNQAIGTLNCLCLKSKQFTEPCLATHQLVSQLSVVQTQGFFGIMDLYKIVGHYIRKTFLKDLLHLNTYAITVDTATKQLQVVLHVCHALQKYTKLCTKMERSASQNFGLIKLATLGLPGGSAMTALQPNVDLGCTLRDLLKTKLNCARTGYRKNMEELMCTNQKTNISFCISLKKHQEKSMQSLINLCQNVCNTSFVGIKKIKTQVAEKVYDITVENDHCFFANNVLVHNCQHWAAETCQVISDHSVNARFKYGLSATPFRDMGDDLLIDACFGKLIADINASFLIQQKILVKPTIYFVHTRKRLTDDLTYAEAYKQGIVLNDERNSIIASIAKNMVSEGRQLLILVRTIEHGNLLEKLIDGSVFLNGTKGSKVRKTHIEDMRAKKIAVTIATSIFDEGVDVKPLDGLILAGSGKSQTRALQRIGRVIRSYEDKSTGFVKKSAYIVDFHDNIKYMLAHSKARRRIYETESEFVIKDFKGSE